MAKDMTYRLMVGSDQVTVLTEEQRAILSDRLSTVVTQYLKSHPNELEDFWKKYGGKK